MATIVPTVIVPAGPALAVGTTMTFTTLTGTADTFVYDPTIPGSVLVMINPTGGSLNPKITGSTAPSAQQFPGYGRINLSAGATVGAIAAGDTRVIDLDSIALWLAGTITITTGTGLSCALLTRG